MSRYYYDCAIEAAYMAKNFDFKLRSTRNQKLYFDGGSDFRSEKDCGIYAGEYYFVDPDSEKLLEPQESDIVRVCTYYDNGNILSECVWKVREQKDWQYWRDRGDSIEIIQRNNRPFIMPKQDQPPVKQEIE